MTIDSTIYDRLNYSGITAIVADRIYSTDPIEQTDWPFVVYTIMAMPPTLCMGKASGNQDYEVKVDVWCKSVAQRITLEAAVKARLHVYSSPPILLSRLNDEQAEQIGTQEEGEIYHSVQNYVLYTTIV
jgi:hypothetical protein